MPTLFLFKRENFGALAVRSQKSRWIGLLYLVVTGVQTIYLPFSASLARSFNLMCALGWLFLFTQRAVADFFHCLTLAEMTFSFGKTFYIYSLQPFDPQETQRLMCCCLFPEAKEISNELTRLEVYYPIDLYVYIWNCFGRKSCCTSTQFIHHKCNSSQIC
jgi:hypothetical protein